MGHCIQFQTETLNTISYKNSSHFMQTISLYLVKISVNVVYYCTIITWPGPLVEPLKPLETFILVGIH